MTGSGGKGGAAAALVLSLGAFAIANSYSACLMSLPGQPIANLFPALQQLPAFILSNGPLSMEPASLASGLLGSCAVWVAWAY